MDHEYLGWSKQKTAKALQFNFIKISLLKTYIVTQKLDVICLSEIYLDSSISNNDHKLEIPGYDLFRANNANLILKEVVFVFIIETLFP